MYHDVGNWKRHWCGSKKQKRSKPERQTSDLVEEEPTIGGSTPVKEPLLQNSRDWFETRIRRRGKQQADPELQDVELGRED